ncbi:MAG: glycoside hydrolase family 28 protein, partial [Bacteroidota bacterium]|nr:glycoside hydrolase family 28 protein [Bacteroidota bacterium]
NCLFDYSRGLALETVDGGLLEDVTISNITLRDIVNSPIFIRLGGRMRGPAGVPVGALRRIIISNVVAYNVDPRFGVIISGIPGHDMENIQLNNIQIYYRGGGTKEQALREVPELENDYPEPYRFKTMPSYGFFIRHVNGIEMNNVRISCSSNDFRPAFILDQVKRVKFLNVSAQKAKDIPLMLLKNVEDFTIHQSFPIADVRLDKVLKKDL